MREMHVYIHTSIYATWTYKYVNYEMSRRCTYFSVSALWNTNRVCICSESERSSFNAQQNLLVEVSQKALYSLNKSRCFKNKIQERLTKHIF